MKHHGNEPPNPAKSLAPIYIVEISGRMNIQPQYTGQKASVRMPKLILNIKSKVCISQLIQQARAVYVRITPYIG